MARKPSFTAAAFLIGLLLLPIFASPLQAQNVPPPTPQQLDQLLAPIALYPDSLLALITTASTNPQEILDVDNWLAQNPGLTARRLVMPRSSRVSTRRLSRWCSFLTCCR